MNKVVRFPLNKCGFNTCENILFYILEFVAKVSDGRGIVAAISVLILYYTILNCCLHKR